jgi:hypothetical protein
MGLHQRFMDSRRGVALLVAATAGTVAWSVGAVNMAVAHPAPPAVSVPSGAGGTR